MQTAALPLRFASATTVTNYELLVKPSKLEAYLARYVDHDLIDLVGVRDVEFIRVGCPAEREMM